MLTIPDSAFLVRAPDVANGYQGSEAGLETVIGLRAISNWLLYIPGIASLNGSPTFHCVRKAKFNLELRLR